MDCATYSARLLKKHFVGAICEPCENQAALHVQIPGRPGRTVFYGDGLIQAYCANDTGAMLLYLAGPAGE